MATFPADAGRSRTEWMGLGEASRVLGVNESTLRRWADAGLVRTFRTPGGHRRFAVEDLERLMAAEDLDPEQFDGEAVEHIRSRLAREEATPSWLDAISPAARTELGELGRRAVHLVERYLDPTAEQGPLQAEAHDVGHRYAGILQSAGVRLPDAVSAFAYFRRGMDESVRAFAESRHLSSSDAGGLWEQVSALEDDVLVALTAAYDSAPAAPEGRA